VTTLLVAWASPGAGFCRSPLLVVFPMGLELTMGVFGLRGSWLPARHHHFASVTFQALYAWMMCFGCMGLFRSLLVRENAAIRYLSDSSYWLYLAHLPLTIYLQTLIRDWPLPGLLKLTRVCADQKGQSERCC
jgi:hypothetical protein